MLIISGVSSGNKVIGVLIIPSTSPCIPINNDIYQSSTLNSHEIKGLYITSKTSI